MNVMTVKCPTREIHVKIVRKKIKNVHLKVYRDLTATLSVPYSTSDSWAEAFVLSKSSWLDKQIEKYKRSSGYNNLTSLRSGSSTRMFGKDLRIYIVNDEKEHIELDEKSVAMHLRNTSNTTHNNEFFENWWKFQAYQLYDELVEKWMPVFKRHGVEKPLVTIKKMKTLWGSCNKEKCKITLNEYLLKADARCIEYVVLHELTHLIYNGHNKDFYDFITIYMPDWKERKKQLDTEVVQGL